MATDTQKYKFNRTLLRVKDPKESLKYYEMLGLQQIDKVEQPDKQSDVYFLAYDSPESSSHGKHLTDREGVLGLLHNHGTENDESFVANNGNKDPHKGFGHTCISVDAIQACCKRIEDAGYKFQKKLTDGRMHSIAFALDPDGYWVEIISFNSVDKTAEVTETKTSTYRFNHSMIRVKDKDASLKFYQEKLGMTLLRTSVNADAKFNLYFLGYPDQSGKSDASTALREGILELTWNYGTEKDEGLSYHNGNDQPQGFRSIGITVDDLPAACERFEQKDVRWQKRITEGSSQTASMLDPDGYWIEVR